VPSGGRDGWDVPLESLKQSPAHVTWRGAFLLKPTRVGSCHTYMSSTGTSSTLFEDARVEALAGAVTLGRAQERVRYEHCPAHHEPATVAYDESQRFITIVGCCEKFRQHIAGIILLNPEEKPAR
jgi:hypothetical protein